MKPFMVTRSIQISAEEVARNVEAKDLGYLLSQMANQFAATVSLEGFLNTAVNAPKYEARRKAVVEIHAQLSNDAKVMLAEVLALEFSKAAAGAENSEAARTEKEEVAS